MKDLILTLLEEQLTKITNEAPEHQAKFHTMDIMDVDPLKLVEFMKENNIPDDAEFSGVDNGYDGYESFVLLWRTPIPITEENRNKWLKEKYNFRVHTIIHKALLKKGYTKRVNEYVKYREFSKVSLYDRVLNKDFDSIYKYYLEVYYLA